MFGKSSVAGMTKKLRCSIEVGIIAMAHQTDFISFELDAVIEVASFDAVVSFGSPFGVDLTFFLATAEFFNLIIQTQVAIESSRVELTSGDGGANGAARIVAMFAILESALQGDLIDVSETFAQRLLIGPHLDLAHAGIVDDQSTFRQGYELT